MISHKQISGIVKLAQRCQAFAAKVIADADALGLAPTKRRKRRAAKVEVPATPKKRKQRGAGPTSAREEE